MITRFLPELGSLDADLREVFLEKLRVRWTHTSTALEGNTLNEGETFGVLRYGLTVSGKPLADHNEVLGHIGEAEHYAIQQQIIDSAMKPAQPQALQKLADFFGKK